jgi:copper homeostasis protein
MGQQGILLELCAYGLHTLEHAAKEGVARVEFCADAPEGGITPSQGALKVGRKIYDGNLVAMIRARGGNFVYSGSEWDAMMYDVELCADLGYEGIICGPLTANDEVDVRRVTQLVQAAGKMEVAFHRAFDATPDPFKTLEVLMDCGVKRVLTTGGAENAWEGREQLKRMAEFVGDRMTIMPGVGIRSHNLMDVVNATGCREVHAAVLSRRNISEGHFQGIPYVVNLQELRTMLELVSLELKS